MLILKQFAELDIDVTEGCILFTGFRTTGVSKVKKKHLV
jgi:hypothetical protein